MHFSQYAGLLMAVAANASPITEAELIARGGVSQVLAPGESLFVSGETMEIVNASRIAEYLKNEGISTETPAIDYDFLNFTAPANTSSTNEKRASCDFTNSATIDTEQRFLDWDVQMGPVVLGVGSGINSFIATGWSVSNSISVSAGIDVTFVKDFLKESVSADYSRTWTTTTSDQYSTLVKAGQAGVWVTRPWTNRKYGRTFRGCIGSLVQTGTYMADYHEDGSYSGSDWVSGFITACLKTAPAEGQHMTRCHGSGDFK